MIQIVRDKEQRLRICCNTAQNREHGIKETVWSSSLIGPIISIFLHLHFVHNGTVLCAGQKAERPDVNEAEWCLHRFHFSVASGFYISPGASGVGTKSPCVLASYLWEDHIAQSSLSSIFFLI